MNRVLMGTMLLPQSPLARVTPQHGRTKATRVQIREAVEIPLRGMPARCLRRRRSLPPSDFCAACEAGRHTDRNAVQVSELGRVGQHLDRSPQCEGVRGISPTAGCTGQEAAERAGSATARTSGTIGSMSASATAV